MRARVPICLPPRFDMTKRCNLGSGITACLLLIYNHIVALRDGKAGFFNPPSAATESIYNRRAFSLGRAARCAASLAPPPDNAEREMVIAPNIALTESALQQLSGEAESGLLYSFANRSRANASASTNATCLSVCLCVWCLFADDVIEPATAMTSANATTIALAVWRHVAAHQTLFATLARRLLCVTVARFERVRFVLSDVCFSWEKKSSKKRDDQTMMCIVSSASLFLCSSSVDRSMCAYGFASVPLISVPALRVEGSSTLSARERTSIVVASTPELSQPNQGLCRLVPSVCFALTFCDVIDSTDAVALPLDTSTLLTFVELTHRGLVTSSLASLGRLSLTLFASV